LAGLMHTWSSFCNNCINCFITDLVV